MPAPDATATVQTSAAAGQLVAGRYLLVRLIASGGMAEVWEATDQVLGRPVAELQRGGRDAARALMRRLQAEDRIRDHDQ